ncbi:phosphate-regulating neutral endopeptidase PHEX-like [Ixodes scapularis]
MHAACAFTTLLLGSIFSDSLEHSRTEIFEGKECRSPVCQMRADLIKTSIDNTVDPCNDFFMFTCGNWIKAQPPMENGQLGHIFNYRKEHIHLVKKAFISGTYNTDFQQAVDKVQMAFQACMKNNRLSASSDAASSDSDCHGVWAGAGRWSHGLVLGLLLRMTASTRRVHRITATPMFNEGDEDGSAPPPYC